MAPQHDSDSQQVPSHGSQQSPSTITEPAQAQPVDLVEQFDDPSLTGYERRSENLVSGREPEYRQLRDDG
jgi:hypothetical protein